MKLIKSLHPYFLYYSATIGTVFGVFISNNAIASPVFFQCQLKNGHMTFSDRPCLTNQKAIQNKKDKKNSMTTTTPTIDIAMMDVPQITRKEDCAYLNRLGIKRKYEIRAREAHSKYWRPDQADELKQVLDQLHKMNAKELAGC